MRGSIYLIAILAAVCLCTAGVSDPPGGAEDAAQAAKDRACGNCNEGLGDNDRAATRHVHAAGYTDGCLCARCLGNSPRGQGAFPGSAQHTKPAEGRAAEEQRSSPSDDDSSEYKTASEGGDGYEAADGEEPECRRGRGDERCRCRKCSGGGAWRRSPRPSLEMLFEGGLLAM